MQGIGGDEVGESMRGHEAPERRRHGHGEALLDGLDVTLGEDHAAIMPRPAC